METHKLSKNKLLKITIYKHKFRISPLIIKTQNFRIVLTSYNNYIIICHTFTTIYTFFYNHYIYF